MAMPRATLRKHSAIGDIESGEQGRRAVSDVLLVPEVGQCARP